MKIITTKEFIKKAKAIHGSRYDYSKVKYIHSQSKVIIICPEHSEFEQTPSNHLLKQNCSKCALNHMSNIKKLSQEEFITRANKIHNNRYDYSKVKYTEKRNKVTIICTEHGEFDQFAGNHLHGYGCCKCMHKQQKFTTEQFIQKAKIKHNDKYDYSKIDYKDSYSKVTIICKEHGDFKQVPASHLQGQGCPTCKSSKGELAIKSILDKHGIENQQEYKLPDEIYLFEYDFYLPKFNILIEFHGKQHYEYNKFFHETYNIFERQQLRDKNKIMLAKEKGIPLLEFNYKHLKHMTKEQFEEMILSNIDKYASTL